MAMEGSATRLLRVEGKSEDGWREAVSRSRSSLRREGFTVSFAHTGRALRGTKPAEFLAANGDRVVRVFVLLDWAVDTEQTRRRITAAYRNGETRVFVRWPLRWRMLSNVARWGLRGVSVTTW